MLGFDALLFSTPWILSALALLPGLWWLLRITPPKPKQIIFPALLLMKGIKSTEDTPHKTPWWLLLLRIAIAFLIILAAAGPSLHQGKTVLFFDTCHSGNVIQGAKTCDQTPDVVKFANELADADSGVIVFCSSAGKQFSLERDEWKNGAFTKALLESINSPAADYQKDWLVSIAELELYLSERVADLTNGEQKPVSQFGDANQ